MAKKNYRFYIFNEPILKWHEFPYLILCNKVNKCISQIVKLFLKFHSL